MTAIEIPALGTLGVRARAVTGTLLVLLAANGVLPLAGHAPAGIWHAAEAAVSAPTTAPAKVMRGK